MTTRRFLPAFMLTLAFTGSASAQYVMPTYPTSSGPTEAPNSLERVTTPGQPPAPGAPPNSDPYATLTGQPAGPGAILPPGSYASPYGSDGTLCCGPLGGGPITYELYADTGPNFVFGTPGFTNRLDTGWMVNGGGKSLFFNKDSSAAWLVDLGLSYSYNHGNQSDPVSLDIRQPEATNTVTGARTNAPDLRVLSTIHALDRTNFNFALGRDWFCWGPGMSGQENGWNLRFGSEVGGRWGTNHVDVVEVGVPNSYERRQKVSHGVFVELHTNFEVPVGGMIWFSGLKVQYGYDWMNIVPPLNGDIQNINLLFGTGLRF